MRRARALGCVWVEFDVRLTGDGALVLCHDARLDRTTNGSGLISAMALSAIREMDAGVRFDPSFTGEPIPTLDEALDLAAAVGLAANIEIKADRGLEYATAAAVAAALRRRQLGTPSILVSSFLVPALGALRSLAPDIPRGLLFRAIPRGWGEAAQRLGCIMIGVDERRLTPRRAAEVRDAGLPLAAFTVNDPARARFLYDWGVTSVFSDAPDIMRAASLGHREPLARQGAIR